MRSCASVSSTITSNASVRRRAEPPLRTQGSPKDLGPMQAALDLAREAYADGEVPVGAVVVDDAGRIIGTGRNRVESNSDVTAHAEMEALRGAAFLTAQERGWRRSGCTLYTTLEPCAMCCAAASLARVKRVVYAAPDLRLGACGTFIDLTAEPHPFHMIEEVANGVCQEESAALMRSFFRERRRKGNTKGSG